MAGPRLDRRGRPAAPQRLLGGGQVERLEDDPPVGRGDRQVGQRRTGGRVVEDDRPRIGAVFFGAEERGQGDEIGPDELRPDRRTSDDVLIICGPFLGAGAAEMRIAGDGGVERLAAGGAMGIALLLDRLAAEGGDFAGRWRTRKPVANEPAGGGPAGAGASAARRRAWLRRAAAGRAFRPGMRPRAFKAPMCLQTAPLISKSGHVQAGAWPFSTATW